MSKETTEYPIKEPSADMMRELVSAYNSVRDDEKQNMDVLSTDLLCNKRRHCKDALISAIEALAIQARMASTVVAIVTEAP